MQESAFRKRAIFPIKQGNFARKMAEKAAKRPIICAIRALTMGQTDRLANRLKLPSGKSSSPFPRKVLSCICPEPVVRRTGQLYKLW
jgi:hypothetical protein